MKYEELKNHKKVKAFIEQINKIVKCKVEPMDIIGTVRNRTVKTGSNYKLTSSTDKYDILFFVNNQKDCDDFKITV